MTLGEPPSYEWAEAGKVLRCTQYPHAPGLFGFTEEFVLDPAATAALKAVFGAALEAVYVQRGGGPIGPADPRDGEVSWDATTLILVLVCLGEPIRLIRCSNSEWGGFAPVPMPG